MYPSKKNKAFCSTSVLCIRAQVNDNDKCTVNTVEELDTSEGRMKWVCCPLCLCLAELSLFLFTYPACCLSNILAWPCSSCTLSLFGVSSNEFRPQTSKSLILLSQNHFYRTSPRARGLIWEVYFSLLFKLIKSLSFVYDLKWIDHLVIKTTEFSVTYASQDLPCLLLLLQIFTGNLSTI